MIVEERNYTLKPECLEDYLNVYEKEGMPIQMSVLPRMLGYFVTEIGELNVIVHMWGYDDLQQRTQKRAELRAAPGWAEYLKVTKPMLLMQQTRILLPMPWSPIR